MPFVQHCVLRLQSGPVLPGEGPALPGERPVLPGEGPVLSSEPKSFAPLVGDAEIQH